MEQAGYTTSFREYAHASFYKFNKKHFFADKELNHILTTLFYKDKKGNFYFGCDGVVGTGKTFGTMIVKADQE